MGRAGGMELGAGTKAWIHQPLRGQLGIGFLIDESALALVIGAVGPAVAAALIPDKAQPAQVFFQLVGVLAGAALRIQIFNAEDDLPALVLGAQPGQQAASQVAQVEPPAGAGGKPPDSPFHSPSFGWKMGVL